MRVFLCLPILLFAVHARAAAPDGIDGLWWAAIGPTYRPPPAVRDPNWAVSPIDRFILARLEAAGLRPAPPASKRELIRRATFDLIGLPPTPRQVSDFLADDSPSAFEKVIDRLLGSALYGQRWGRHWLDVARYADSNGLDENMAFPNAFRYRDWVVRAFNRDQPYDDFLREQLAGDLLDSPATPSQTEERLIATGFLAIGPKSLREVDGVKMELDIIDEQVATVGRALLGLTLDCARCHDHKFDPISTKDYYALAGIFASTRSMERYTLDGVGNGVWLERALPTDASAFAMAVIDGTVRDLAVHIRGSHLSLGAVMRRRFPQVLTALTPGPKKALSPGQSGRLELAQWLTDADHPLTSRVMANRIWQGHFGRGLVGTPDNFGRLGEAPTHPELLDWLANRFVESGWSIKSMHRLIMLTSTYGMSTDHDPAAEGVDPGNRLYWRMNRRRLESEEVRDAVLAASGTLDLRMGGRALALKKGEYVTDGKTSRHLVTHEGTRRSIYLPVVRNVVFDLLQVFDFPDPTVVGGNRSSTTVAPQALLLLNSPWMLEQSRSMAGRLMSQADASDSARLEMAYLLAYARPPDPDETTAAFEYLEQYRNALARDGADGKRENSAWQSLCQALLSSNEFLYVE